MPMRLPLWPARLHPLSTLLLHPWEMRSLVTLAGCVFGTCGGWLKRSTWQSPDMLQPSAQPVVHACAGMFGSVGSVSGALQELPCKLGPAPCQPAK